MKIVRICKEPTRLVFSNKMDQAAVSLKVKYKNAKKAPKVKDINNEDDFQKALSTKKKRNSFSINGFFSSGDYREHQVFIVLDDWKKDGSFDHGYEMARDLLNNVGEDKIFNLYFVSRFDQEYLLGSVENENKIMVKSFPHLWLLDQKVLLNPAAYSTIHFRLVRDIAVSDKGRLAAIRHEVKNVVLGEKGKDLMEQCVTQKRHVLSILDDLDCKVFHQACFGYLKRLDELRAQADKLSANVTYEELEIALSKLQSDLYQLIDLVERELLGGGKGNKQQKKARTKEGYRVLIVDDDLRQRKELFDFFNARYQYVACNDIQEVLKKGIKHDNSVVRGLTLKDSESALKWFGNEKNLQDFDIIILDLLFKHQDTHVWLPFNGLDLLRLVRTNSPYSTVRIITSLPRNEISHVLGEEKIDLPMNHIFTKSNGWLQLEGCLCDRRDEIEKDCKSNAQLRDFANEMQGPSKGFFNEASVRRMIAELRNMKVGDQSSFDICFQNAQKMLDPSFIKDNPRDSITLPKHESGIIYDDTVLTNYMAHRIAFLQWSANHFPGQLRGIDIDEYHVALEDLHIKKKEEDGKVKTPGKTYFHDLGFGFSEKKHKKTVTLSFGDMFPEEVELFKQIARGKGLSVQVSDDVCNWIFGVVKNGCYDLKDDDVIFKDFSVEQVFTYAKVKDLFDKCCRIVSDGSSGPGIADRNKRIVDFLESMFLRESFNDEGIGDSYDAVMAKLKEQGIFMPIISETCVKEWVKKVLKKGGCERMFGEFPSETIFNTIANSALVTYDDINELVEVRNNARNNPIYTSQDKSKMESFFNRVLSTEQYPEVMAVLKEKGIIEP